MSSISRTDAAAQISRAKAVDARRRSTAGPTTPESLPSQPVPAAFDLEEDVARRVGAIGADEPNPRQRVARAFLESCVARTFGASAPQDPAFGHIIDQARDAIRADPHLSAAMDRMVERLWSARRPAP